MLFFPLRVVLLVLSLGYQNMWTCGSSITSPRWFVPRRLAGLGAGHLAAESEFLSENSFSNWLDCPEFVLCFRNSEKILWNGHYSVALPKTMMFMKCQEMLALWQEGWGWGVIGEPLIIHRVDRSVPWIHVEWWPGCWWSADAGGLEGWGIQSGLLPGHDLSDLSHLWGL